MISTYYQELIAITLYDGPFNNYLTNNSSTAENNDVTVSTYKQYATVVIVAHVSPFGRWQYSVGVKNMIHTKCTIFLQNKEVTAPHTITAMILSRCFIQNNAGKHRSNTRHHSRFPDI